MTLGKSIVPCLLLGAGEANPFFRGFPLWFTVPYFLFVSLRSPHGLFGVLSPFFFFLYSSRASPLCLHISFGVPFSTFFFLTHGSVCPCKELMEFARRHTRLTIVIFLLLIFFFSPPHIAILPPVAPTICLKVSPFQETLAETFFSFIW